MRLLTLIALVGMISTGAADLGSDDFRMTIRDAFTITGQGVVLTGIVEGGPVSVDDVVCFRPADGDERELTVKGIEMFRKLLETAEPGAMVGLLFEGIETSDVSPGDLLTASCE
jgi:elongation factor Tu